ncbi:heavy-metal-associated domain-containing protein [Streptomyces sp. ME19-01-6]|uniref:heavy-metal-associated domain-containing protein n=1 Tax=Streptomyces sp. ME19-01-6 TaxID=3028686 RepID=UPI0029B73156|nr:cation transporter [Streptomyces sp. ME19-01-6]MDX3229254.1 cation transporter [Streptomyces sp. ME19-01-6]
MSSSCCSPNNTCSTAAQSSVAVDGIRTVYAVAGMTCGHCKDAITTAVGAVEGVASVEVDLASGQVTVVSAADLDDRVIAAAVDDAGYELTGRAA